MDWFESVCDLSVKGCGPEDLVVWAGFIVAILVAYQLRKYAGPVVDAMEKRVHQLETDNVALLRQNNNQQSQIDVLREEVGGAKAIALLHQSLTVAVTQMSQDHNTILAGQTRMMEVLQLISHTQENTAALLEQLLARRRNDREGGGHGDRV